MHLNKDVNLSYWELKSYFRPFDLIIIGSGIVGLSTAISYRLKHKKASIVILERGILPDGASTRNAGFACFGSAGELLDDLEKMPADTVWETVEMRWLGLQMLRKRLGDKAISYEGLGGYELFDNIKEYKKCLGKIEWLNKNMRHVIGKTSCFKPSPYTQNRFKNVAGVLVNSYEGQIDTGLMMQSLLELAGRLEVKVLNNINISLINDTGSIVEMQSNAGVFSAHKVVVATNGFAAKLLSLDDVKPARAQVLITKPVPGLKIKGSYHYEQGYYYFRNIDGRILLGGGRNLDLEGEATYEQGLNNKIQQRLDELLREMVLPGTPVEIEHRWSGIMGIGSEKKPIIRNVSNNVLAAVRMGGMGVAIGSWVGEKAAREIA